MRFYIFAFAALLSVPAVTLAQSVPAAPPSLAAADIDRMCSETGIFQYAFGETGVPTTSPFEQRMQMALSLPETYAPFSEASPHATQWSQALFAAEFTGEFTGDADFYALIHLLDRELAHSGWQKSDPIVPGQVPIFQIGYRGQISWHRDVQSDSGSTRLLLNIAHSSGRITLGCAREDLLRRSMEEAFGEIPDGTPRPVLPELPFAPVPTVEACLAPEFSGEIDSFLEGDGPGLFTSTMLARSDYNDRITKWTLWRLEQAGMTSDEGFRLAMSAIQLGDGPDGHLASLDRLMQLFPVTEQLANAHEAGDREAACQSFVEITAIYDDLESNASLQTAEFVRLANIEAERLGISLD